MLRALEHGVGIEQFWDLTNGELWLFQRASLNRRRADEETLVRSLYLSAAWVRGGLPPWEDVRALVRGEPKRKKTAAELFAVAKAFVRQLGGKVRGKAVKHGG